FDLKSPGEKSLVPVNSTVTGFVNARSGGQRPPCTNILSILKNPVHPVHCSCHRLGGEGEYAHPGALPHNILS
ncbi:MAG TPA: hypothetical protein VF254_04705, partial [Gammaproteobacteria bacterium]